MTEVAHLQSSDRDVIPDNVRAVLQRRLSRLSEATIQLLTVGSVMGREFDFRIAAAIVQPARDPDLLSALDEALERLIVEPMPAAGESWYRFRHALVRDAVYESVSPSRRAHWHAAVVELMEQRLGARVEEHAADLAYHAARAEALVGSSRVVKYSRLAGERMLATHAFDEALRHFERAWRARNSVPCDDEAAGILAGLGLAQAATTVRWNRQEAWANVRRAIEYYLEAGEIQKAVAAVTHASLAAEGVAGVTDVIRRLLPFVREGSREAALLLARGAAAAYFETGSDQPTQQWFARALGIASSHEDAGLELRVLAQSISVDHFALRWHDALVKSRRVLELAGRVDELHWQAYASYRAAFVLTHTLPGKSVSLQGTPPAGRWLWIGWTLFCLAMVWALRRWMTSDKTAGVPAEWSAVWMAVLSFVVWVYSFGDVFQLLGWWDQRASALISHWVDPRGTRSHVRFETVAPRIAGKHDFAA